MCDVLGLRRSSVHPLTSDPQEKPSPARRHPSPARTAARGSQSDELLKPLRTFSREAGVYQSLMSALGSVRDSPGLREELGRSRRRLCDLARANQSSLLPHLRRRAALTSEDEDEYHKLWNIFSACLELVQIYVHKSLQLTVTFPLHQESCILIRTGQSDAIHPRDLTEGSRQSMGQSSSGSAGSPERQQFLLKKDCGDISTLLSEVQNKVDVKPWMFDAPSSKEYEIKPDVDSDGASEGTSNISMVAVGGARRRKFIHIVLIVVFAGVTLVAVVTGVCVKFLT